MRHRGRTGREQIFHRVGSLHPQDAHVAQAVPGRSAASAAHAAEQPLDAEKIALRKSLRHRDEKRPVAAPEIDFQRSRSRKNLREIERREVVCGNQFNPGSGQKTGAACIRQRVGGRKLPVE